MNDLLLAVRPERSVGPWRRVRAQAVRTAAGVGVVDAPDAMSPVEWALARRRC